MALSHQPCCQNLQWSTVGLMTFWPRAQSKLLAMICTCPPLCHRHSSWRLLEQTSQPFPESAMDTKNHLSGCCPGTLSTDISHLTIIFYLQICIFSSQVAPVVKNPPANAGDMRDMGSVAGSGRFPGGGNGNPLQYSCLENPMDGSLAGRTRLKRLSAHTPSLRQVPRECGQTPVKHIFSVPSPAAWHKICAENKHWNDSQSFHYSLRQKFNFIKKIWQYRNPTSYPTDYQLFYVAI